MFISGVIFCKIVEVVLKCISVQITRKQVDIDDVVVRNPTTIEKILTKRKLMYHFGDVLAVILPDQFITRRQDAAQATRYRSKGRMLVLKEYRSKVLYKNRTPDPPSDNKGAGIM